MGGCGRKRARHRDTGMVVAFDRVLITLRSHLLVLIRDDPPTVFVLFATTLPFSCSCS